MFLNTFQQDQGALVAGALRLRDGALTLAGARVDGAGSLAVTGGTGSDDRDRVRVRVAPRRPQTSRVSRDA
jgi:hypothetical protein